MKKKQAIFFLLTFCAICQLFAQRDTLFYNKQKWEMGLNVTGVIVSFVGNQADQTISPGSYQLYSKLVLGNKQRNAIRVGLGGGYADDKRAATNQSFLTQRNITGSVRLGYEWRTYITKRCMFFGGFDLLSQNYSRSSITATTIDATNRNNRGWAAGVGPVMGFQFAINKRIHIGTESSIYGVFQDDQERLLFQLNPNLNTNTHSQSTTVSFNAPKWLYLVVRL